TRFLRVHARDVAVLAVGVRDPGVGMVLAGLAGDALRHHPRVLVDEDAHECFFFFAVDFGFFFAAFFFTAATTFFPASAIVSAGMIGRPESLRIFLPRSSLVPFMRTTSGTERFTSLAAPTTPSAMVSHFMMPPKMLTRIALTFGLESMILNAAVT